MTRATLRCGFALMALGTVFLWGCASQPPAAETQQTAQTQQAAAHPEQALLEELALGNRMLARELAILDIQGHLTARSRINPNHYYIARFLSPGAVTTTDFIENDLDSNPVNGPRNDQAREIYLHGEISGEAGRDGDRARPYAGIRGIRDELGAAVEWREHGAGMGHSPIQQGPFGNRQHVGARARNG